LSAAPERLSKKPAAPNAFTVKPFTREGKMAEAGIMFLKK
jgi:hypothetical protein